MAIYSFICDCGETQEVNRPMSEATEPVFCVICKQRMCRHYQADFGKQHFGDTYPFNSDALGVSLAEVPAMMKFDREHGVSTTYDGNGNPEMRNKKHRREYAQAHGFHDRNAGYSDPVPARCR